MQYGCVLDERHDEVEDDAATRCFEVATQGDARLKSGNHVSHVAVQIWYQDKIDACVLPSGEEL